MNDHLSHGTEVLLNDFRIILTYIIKAIAIVAAIASSIYLNTRTK